MMVEINAKAQVHNERMMAFVDELKSCRKGMMACQREKMLCPQKSKSDPDVMEDAVDTYKEILDEMKTSGKYGTADSRESESKTTLDAGRIWLSEDRR
jgi:hypothetical protein